MQLRDIEINRISRDDCQEEIQEGSMIIITCSYEDLKIGDIYPKPEHNACYVSNEKHERVSCSIKVLEESTRSDYEAFLVDRMGGIPENVSYPPRIRFWKIQILD